MHSRLLLVFHVLYVLFMHISLLQPLAFNPEGNHVTTQCIERERQALVSLKRGFQLNKDWLSSWGDGENKKECCKWEGIECCNKTGHVLKLDLHAYDYVTFSSVSPSLDKKYTIRLKEKFVRDAMRISMCIHLE